MGILVALVMLFSTIVDGQIILDEPVQYPTDFYQLYDLVESGAHGWVFDECEVSGSRLHWQSAVNLFEETEPEFENEAFGLVSILFLEGYIDICGDHQGKPILFGDGVTEFLKWYSDPEGYDTEWILIEFAEGLARALNVLYLDE
ncbi:MAG: hypothetical protein ACYS5F_14140 [Planctomycetota bacterium]|jgi:hypothetical protein